VRFCWGFQHKFDLNRAGRRGRRPLQWHPDFFSALFRFSHKQKSGPFRLEGARTAIHINISYVMKGFASDNARPCRDHRLLIVSIGFPSQVMYA
jgi:hypothetical protein